MTDTAGPGVRTEADELAITFARVLRELGLAAPIGSVIDFVEAIGLLGVDARDSVYWAGRTTLVRRPEDLTLYDRAFRVFWEQRRGDHDRAHRPQRMRRPEGEGPVGGRLHGLAQGRAPRRRMMNGAWTWSSL